MSEVQIPTYVKSFQLEAKIIRANGEEEDLGTIATWSRNNNPLKKLLKAFKK